MKKLLLIGLLSLIVLIAGCIQPNPVACTEEARLCPDGSSVARVPPTCEFAECPETIPEQQVPDPKLTPRQPDFTILSPLEGETVSDSFSVEIVPINFSLGIVGSSNNENIGHFHFALDDEPFVVVSSLNYDFSDIKPGKHSLKISMQNNDHSDIGVMKTISFIVQTTNPGFDAMVESTTESSAIIKIDMWNFAFGNIGRAIQENKGHFHYFLNNDTLTVLEETEFELSDLSPGVHSVRIVMQNNDHSDYLVNGKTVEQTIEFSTQTIPAFGISSPKFNEIVGSPAEFVLDVNNFSIVQPNSVNLANEGHFHYTINNGPVKELFNTSFSLNGLKPNTYTVRITAHRNDHSIIASMKSQSVKVLLETPKPGFDILIPTISNNTAQFNLDIWNFVIGKLNDPKRIGYGHFHYFVDNGEANELEKTSISLENLSSGSHSLRVRLQHQEHSDYLVDESIVEKTLDFIIP